MSATSTAATRRWIIRITLVILLLTAGACITWAVIAVLQPATDPLKARTFTLVQVAEGEVGADIRLNAVAEWTVAPVGSNQAAGVVTSVSVAPGEEVGQGAVLYTVDLRPIVVGQGQVPAFRDIGDGTNGPDVQQLQEMLGALGFYSGPADGDAGPGTVRGIKAWQKSLGVEQTGSVRKADVIFVPALPTRVTIDTSIVSRGAALSGNEEVLSALSSSPLFTLPVTSSQAGLIPSGTQVEITSPSGGLWDATAGEQTGDSDTDIVTIKLMAIDGGAICGADCASIPVTGETSLASRVITTGTVSGLVVPSAALVTSATGRIELVGADGTRYPVAVQASARGMSVINGVNEGFEVRVPATDDGSRG